LPAAVEGLAFAGVPEGTAGGGLGKLVHLGEEVSRLLKRR